ncbi:Lysine-specific permease [Ralstonia mannitolilytica]|uniref:amino acid permease n=1 Tax=Ralstonia mannitolilytica TaxID=105219 RepID=UPI0007AFE8C7|nr:amino acid permease [Ralstonia mannitolilytica]ANA31963.1 gamma-aminobutyrate permease [Ralstonia mannitolilytica]CAJ0694984.1 Lysine-specific permease [Ralstonia mannitolilytica]CAJ0799171.1 Lysine-specific permease [Ralstonia mannitolilytica]CAJ0873300.1 Lysine-specific permease [Ralstonia mannitolilytica]
MHTPITPTGLEAQSQLRRRLRSRHIMMIALSGAIGTGLFVASGASIAQAGPGGALLTYTLIGVMVYCLMTSLGELAVHLPVSGSFVTYSRLYVEEGFGFALGWNYWFSLAVTVAVELAAAQLVMKYWFPGVSGIVWSAAFLLLMFMLNAFSVRGFGEAEYWFSMVKVVTIVVFLLIGLAMIFGIMHGGPASGWHNFTVGDAPFVGGVPAMVGVAMIAGFSFQGVETVGVAAGEAENPSRTIPRAIRQTFWRILLFYVLAILIIGVLLPYTDPNLLRNEATDIGVSPFTLVFQHAGLAFAAGMMNAVVLTALLSSGTSSLYVSTRILYDLALEGQAPRWFAKVSGNGVPHRALVVTSAVGALCFFSSLFGDQVVYLWLLNTSAVTCFIAWFGIALAHYRFRKGFVSQGHSVRQLAYRSPFFPFGPIMVAILCVVIILGQNTKALLAPVENLGAFLSTYCGVFVFVAIWLGYRWKFKTRFVPYAQMQFSTAHLAADAADAPAGAQGDARPSPAVSGKA